MEHGIASPVPQRLRRTAILFQHQKPLLLMGGTIIELLPSYIVKQKAQALHLMQTRQTNGLDNKKHRRG